MDNIYPIGSIFISTNTTNPSTYFGGKWERIKGRFLLAADDSTYKIGVTGGEATHKLTTNEMPSHSHGITTYRGSSQWALGYIWARAATNSVPQNQTWVTNTSNAGGNQAHNNMPPYLVVYIWKRIS